MASTRLSIVLLFLLSGVLISEKMASNAQECTTECDERIEYMTCPSSGYEQLAAHCSCCQTKESDGCTLHLSDGSQTYCPKQCTMECDERIEYMTCPSSGYEQLPAHCSCCQTKESDGCTLHLSDGSQTYCAKHCTTECDERIEYMTCPSSGYEQLPAHCSCCQTTGSDGCTLHLSDGSQTNCP